jgi:L-amino acid N-acyltransferase YncA
MKYNIKIYWSIIMVNIRECSITDIETLAQLNKMLIEDEKADNKMNTEELKERMGKFLKDGYKAYYFLEGDNRILGYALCDLKKTPMYLRQFYIKREERRKGKGKESFKKLIEYTKREEIGIDVYAWNDVGIKFWVSLGFKNKYMHMEYRRDED